MSASKITIHCEIIAPSYQSGGELGHIAKTCAIDLKLANPLAIAQRAPSSASETSITLHIPLEAALACEAIWKLASRIASFCPSARVCAEINNH